MGLLGAFQEHYFVAQPRGLKEALRFICWVHLLAPLTVGRGGPFACSSCVLSPPSLAPTACNTMMVVLVHQTCPTSALAAPRESHSARLPLIIARPAASFHSLSPELLLRVFAQLDPSLLRMAALVCRRWHSLLTSEDSAALWEAVQVRWARWRARTAHR